MLNWLWERIHVQERIQKRGHKCASWIWARQKEEGSRLPPFLCSCPVLCKDCEKVSSHLPQKEVGKRQRCQSSEDDKETNKTEKKKSVAIFSNNSRNTNMVL